MPVLPLYRNHCSANQLTGFYMRATLAFNGLTKVNYSLSSDTSKENRNHLASAHLGFSEGRGPNFRKGAKQYKTKKK